MNEPTRIVTFEDDDGYMVSIRADRVDAISKEPGADWVRIYVAGSDEPFAVKDTLENAVSAVWGVKIDVSETIE